MYGFEAKVTVSSAGFRAVPQPFHCSASGVAGSGGTYPREGAVCNSLSGLCEYPATVNPCPSGANFPAARSMALPTSRDFGKPLFPVMKTFPFRRATNAPVLTVGHQIRPLYSMAVTVATVV